MQTKKQACINKQRNDKTMQQTQQDTESQRTIMCDLEFNKKRGVFFVCKQISIYKQTKKRQDNEPNTGRHRATKDCYAQS